MGDSLPSSSFNWHFLGVKIIDDELKFVSGEQQDTKHTLPANDSTTE